GFDQKSPWSFSAEDGDALLGSGGDNWEAYGNAHLGIDPSAQPKTKERYKYPFAKKSGGSEKLYRSAIRAIRSRASQQGDTSIFDAAGSLLQQLGGNDSIDPAEWRKL